MKVEPENVWKEMEEHCYFIVICSDGPIGGTVSNVTRQAKYV
jgi:hypothetical protein